MYNNLLTSLINKGIVHVGTELGIIRPGVGIDGSYVTTSHILITERGNCCKRSEANHIVEVFNIGFDGEDNSIPYVLAYSTIDGKRFKIRAEHIHIIDGMNPADLARSYGLDENGVQKRRGKKRGRKSKKELYEQNNRVSQ